MVIDTGLQRERKRTMRLAIQKLGYSRSPWRLVDLDAPPDWNGPQQIVVPVPYEHPYLGITTIDEAVSGETKGECMERTLALLGRLIEQRKAEVAKHAGETA